MNASVIQPGTTSHGAPGLASLPMGMLAFIDQNDGSALPRLRKDIESQIKMYEFRGRLEIPGAPFLLPEQDFIATFTPDGNIRFENRAFPPWPKILIELAITPTNGSAKVKQFQIQPAQDSAETEIFYTRVQFVLGKTRRCELQFGDGTDNLPFTFDPPTPNDEQQLLHRAKIYRKLKFIEQAFNTKFLLPKEISGDEVAVIEFVFRAITEGEFSTRRQVVTLPLDPSKIDLSKPPFDGPGPLTYESAEDWLELFGQRLLLSNLVVTLRQVEIASPQAVRQISQGQHGPIWVRFDILDHQIHYRLENRATRSAKRLQLQKLNSYRQELSKNEPMELVNLLDETLMADVSAEEASLIAMGWMQYNRLPDRFCPQAPVLAEDSTHWRVPIHLVYTTGNGGPVGEIVIDKKTGEVISHTSIEELRSKGMILAKAVLHAD
jgi:hypothetical protein